MPILYGTRKFNGACGSVVGSSPEWGEFFFSLLNSSIRTMALGSTQPLIEMSTRNFPGGKKRQGRRADELAECLKMWESQPLATLRASTASTGITLPCPNVCYPVHKFWRVNSISRQISPVYTLTWNFLNIIFNIILPTTSVVLPSRLFHLKFSAEFFHFL
jgi:hypothetical protein